MGIAIIACLAYNMLLGQGGMLSFGHAVYSGLGGFLAIHALNKVGAGSLHLPVSLVPLVGGAGRAGLRGAVRLRHHAQVGHHVRDDHAGHRRAGVFDVADAAGVLRRRGRRQQQPRRAAGGAGRQLRPADPGLLPDRAVLLRVHRPDVRVHAHAAGPHAQRGARQPRARGLHRLRHAARALVRVHDLGPVRRHRGRPGGDQLRARHRRGRRRAALGRLPAVHVPGRLDGVLRARSSAAC